MGTSLALSAIAQAILGIACLALRRSIVTGTLPRNGAFGIRTNATMTSDAAWAAGHEAAAPVLRTTGYVDCALAAALVVFSLLFPDVNTTLGMTVWVLAYVAGFAGIIIAARKANQAAKAVD